MVCRQTPLQLVTQLSDLVTDHCHCRQECMKRNKAALVTHRENENLSCTKCCGKLREFSVSVNSLYQSFIVHIVLSSLQKFSIFVCNSGRSQCPSGKKNFSHGPTRTRTRYLLIICISILFRQQIVFSFYFLHQSLFKLIKS